MSLAFSALIVALGLWLPAAHADDVAYVYDELGRLVQATNATAGEAVLYAYDAVGNITSQRTIALTTLAVGHFTPKRGPIGTQVTISGTGFNAVPAANTVRFNGAAASVVSASPTQIVAVVPASATTGLVTVEVGAATATGSNAFVVTATADQPTITAVLPDVGTAGVPITIVGTNFEALPALNRVRLNSSPALVTGSTATTISMLVPANTGSGRIRVTTPRGIAVSATDFVVVPAGYAASQVNSVERIGTDGAPSATTLQSAWTIGLRLFDGVAGELLTIGVGSTTFSNCTIRVFGPDATLLESSVITEAGQGVQLPKLPKSGTYTIVVDGGANTGSISLGVFKPLTGTVTMGGAGSTVSVSPPGRRALITFNGTQGTYANVALSGVTVPAGKVSVFTPTGAELVSTAFTTDGAFLQPLLPRTGTYVVLIDPAGSVGGSATLSVATSSTPALAPNTGAHTINLPDSDPVSLTFRGEPGQYMSLAAFVQATSYFGATIVVRDPNGSQLATKTPTTSYTVGNYWRGSGVLNIGPLQHGGTYTVVVQRADSVSGSVDLTLTSASTGTLSSNGVSSNVEITHAGQSVLRSFSANAGEVLSFAVEEQAGFITGATITVLSPDGSVLTTDSFAPPLGDGGVLGGGEDNYRDGGKVVNLGPLSVSGIYRVLLQQIDSARKEDDYTGVLRLTLAKPVTGTIGVNAATVSTEINVIGQGLRYTFQGTAGQYLALGMSSNLGRINAAVATVLDPAGVPVAAGGMVVTTTSGGDIIRTFGSAVVNLGPLATSGTYTLLVQQAGSKADSTGTIDLTLSTPLTIPIGSSGSASNLEITRPGQGVLFSFSGAAGEYLAFHVYAHGMISAASMTVLDPSGAAIASGTMPTVPFAAYSTGGDTSAIGGYDGKAVLSFGPLPVTGNYSILFQQTGAGATNVGPLTVRLTAPLTGPLSSNSATYTVDINTRGQGGLYTFTANAGEYRALAISESSGYITSAAVSILNAQGVAIATGNLSTTASDGSSPTYSGRLLLNIGPIPVTGTYRVLVQQNGNGAGETGTLSLTFSQPATGSLSVGAPAVAPVAWPGQGILYTFTGAYGQHLSLTVSEAIGSYISNASIKLLSSEGTQLVAGTFAASNCSGCGNSYAGSATINSGPLPATGTYSVLVQQTALAGTNLSFGTGELTLALTELQPGTGSSTNVSTTTPGQPAIANFTASAGESVSVAIQGVVLTPATDAYYRVNVFSPDNGYVAGGDWWTGWGMDFVLALRNLPQSGTYRIEVTPSSTQTISGTVIVSSAFAGALNSGVPVAVTLSTAGQAAQLSFTAAAGQTFALNIDSLSTTPADTVMYVDVFNSAGAQVAGGQTTSGLTFNLPSLAADTYFVWIRPQTAATSTMQVTLHPEVGGTPENGTPTSFSSFAPGQVAYFDFSANAGQSMSVAIQDVVLAPAADGYFRVNAFGPDGNYVGGTDWWSGLVGDFVMALRNLPHSGVYRIEVIPSSTQTISGTLVLSPAFTGTLSPTVPVTVNLNTVGQAAQLSFTAAAGQTFALNIDSLSTTPADTVMYVDVFNSAGAQVAGGQTTSGLTFNLPSLAADTYFVWIRPQTAATSTMQVTLHPKVGGTLEIGAPASFSSLAPGQIAYFSFAAIAGQSVSVAMQNVLFVPASEAYHRVNVFGPDGNYVDGTYWWSGSGDFELGLRNLPQGGTYRIEVIPPSTLVISGTVVVSSAVTGTLSPGVPATVNLSTVGQAAHLSFTATAGQSIALNFDLLSTAPANTAMYVNVYDSAGAHVTGAWLTTQLTLNMPNLAAGTYSVWIVPQVAATGSMTVGY